MSAGGKYIISPELLNNIAVLRLEQAQLHRHKISNDEYKLKAESSLEAFKEAFASIEKLTKLETAMKNKGENG